MKLQLPFIFLFLLLFFSCQKMELERPMKGSHPRLIKLDRTLALHDPFNTSISMEVDFYDEDEGAHVESFQWKVIFQGNGFEKEAILETKEKKDFFIQSTSGLSAVGFEWSYERILDALDLEKESVNDNCTFTFIATLTRDDENTFTALSLDPPFYTPFTFDGFYKFEAELICKGDLSGKVMEIIKTPCDEDWQEEMEW